jgi:hypothetical protein
MCRSTDRGTRAVLHQEEREEAVALQVLPAYIWGRKALWLAADQTVCADSATRSLLNFLLEAEADPAS